MKFTAIKEKNSVTITGFYGDLPDVLEIPEKLCDGTVHRIATGAFSNCKELKEVILPKTCVILSHRTFSNCVNLKKINLENVVVLKEQTFRGCKSLEGVELNEQVQFRESTFEPGVLENSGYKDYMIYKMGDDAPLEKLENLQAF